MKKILMITLFGLLMTSGHAGAVSPANAPFVKQLNDLADQLHNKAAQATDIPALSIYAQPMIGAYQKANELCNRDETDAKVCSTLVKNVNKTMTDYDKARATYFEKKGPAPGLTPGLGRKATVLGFRGK